MQTENRSHKIAVTGATGRVGSYLVEILERRGHDVVSIARSKGVDVVSGEGLDEALSWGGDHHRYGNRSLARPGGGDGLLHRLGAEPSASRRRGRGEADRRCVDHRHR